MRLEGVIGLVVLGAFDAVVLCQSRLFKIKRLRFQSSTILKKQGHSKLNKASCKNALWGRDQLVEFGPGRALGPDEQGQKVKTDNRSSVPLSLRLCGHLSWHDGLLSVLGGPC